MNYIEAEWGIQHWGLEEQVSSIYTAEGPTCCRGEKKQRGRAESSQEGRTRKSAKQTKTGKAMKWNPVSPTAQTLTTPAS